MDGNLDDIALGNTGGAMLFLEEVLAGVDKATLWQQSHNLSTGDADAAVLSTAAHFVECHVQWSSVDIGDIHRYLGNLIFVDIPANGLCAFKGAGLHDHVAVLVLFGSAGNGIALTHGAAFLAHIKGDGVGTASAGGVQVEVGGDEEVACSYCSAAGAGHFLVEGTCAEVGFAALGGKFLGKSLIFALTAHRQVAALGGEGCRLVAVAGNFGLVGDALGKFACKFGALFKSDTCDGDERAHVGGTHAWVCSVMLSHINEFASAFHSLKSCLNYGFWAAHKSHHGAVGSLTWVHVEQFHTLSLANNVGYLINHVHVAALAKIGHAFNKSVHVLCVKCLWFYSCSNFF